MLKAGSIARVGMDGLRIAVECLDNNVPRKREEYLCREYDGDEQVHELKMRL
jgi:hypothetical protein